MGWHQLPCSNLYIGQQHPITVYRTVFFFVRCSGVECLYRCSCYYFLDRIIFHHEFHHDSCDYQCDYCGHSLLFELHFRLSVTKQFWFCKCTTHWMFPPLDIIYIGLNMLRSDSFMSCLHSLLGYSTREFHALKLIVLAAFGAVV